MKELIPALQRFKKYPQKKKLESGFNILETVVGVGLILTLSAGGIVTYGGVTENAIHAKTQQASSSVYKLAMFYALDSDPNTHPEDAEEEYNQSNSSIRVSVKPTSEMGGLEVVRTAAKTSINSQETLNDFKKSLSGMSRGGGGGRVPTMIIPAAPANINDTYCVTATWLDSNKEMSSSSGVCHVDNQNPEEPEGPGETEPPIETPPPVEPTDPPIETEPPVGPTDPPVPTDPPGPTEIAPTGFKSGGSTRDTATISWNAIDGFNDYVLERSLKSDMSDPVKMVVENNNGFSRSTTITKTDTNLDSNTEYFYRVKVSPGASERWTIVLKIKTSVASMSTKWDFGKCGDTSVTLPISGAIDGSGTIDWGDGTTSPLLNKAYHSYGIGYKGAPTITILGDFTSWGSVSTGWEDCITSVDDWGSAKITSLKRSFYNASSITYVADPPKTVTDMSDMFRNASSYNQSIGHWDVSNVTDMSGMFNSAFAFNQPIEKWNVSNVKNMGNMFNQARAFNQPLNGWNTSNVENMSNMFSNTLIFDRPLNNWDTSKVIDMGRMFYSNKVFNQDLSGSDLKGWNVNKVTNSLNFATNATKMLANPAHLPKFK